MTYIELRIQGRTYSGKLSFNVARQVNLKWEALKMFVHKVRTKFVGSSKIIQTIDFHCFSSSAADKFLKMPTGHLSASSDYGRFSRL